MNRRAFLSLSAFTPLAHMLPAYGQTKDVLGNLPPPREMKAAIVSRLKLMAKLNIAERRLPQDGRIKIKILGREVDLRVSTLPTLYGESVVMRLLYRSTGDFYDLRRLGFDEHMLARMEHFTSLPHGIFLVTGPTGSGKSTTLYSALKRINLLNCDAALPAVQLFI